MLGVPDWAGGAVLLDGAVYLRTLVPDSWIPMGPGETLTSDELLAKGVDRFLDHQPRT